MKQTGSAFIVGLIFGLGLTISQMINPAKVLGFLDIAGGWDPSLVFVLGAAVMVTGTGYFLVLRRDTPLLGGTFQLPGKTHLDRRLFGGAAVFGIGWGLAGLCPGPAFAGLGTGAPQALIFLAAMAGGTIGFKIVDGLARSRPALTVDG